MTQVVVSERRFRGTQRQNLRGNLIIVKGGCKPPEGILTPNWLGDTGSRSPNSDLNGKVCVSA